MPRTKGHDGTAVKLLECLENARMGLGRMEFELDLIMLRTKQARQRKPDLTDLLEPGETTIADLRKQLDAYKAEINRAIHLSKTAP